MMVTGHFLSPVAPAGDIEMLFVRLSVRLSVCPSRFTVLAITCHRFIIGPPNLYQIFTTQRPRTSSMMSDLDLFPKVTWAKSQRNTVLTITFDRLIAGPPNSHQVCISWRPRTSSMMSDLDLFSRSLGQKRNSGLAVLTIIWHRFIVWSPNLHQACITWK